MDRLARELRAALRELAARWGRQWLLLGLLQGVVFLVGGLWGVLLLTLGGPLSPHVLGGLLGVLLAGGLLLAGRALHRARRRSRPGAVAREVEVARPGWEGRLLPAWELGGSVDSSLGYSEQLIAALLEEALVLLRGRSVAELLPGPSQQLKRRLVGWGRASLTLSALLLATAILLAPNTRKLLQTVPHLPRLLRPQPVPELRVIPGDAHVRPGESLHVWVSPVAGEPGVPRLLWQSGSRAWGEERPVEEHGLSFWLRNLYEETRYLARWGRAESDTFLIQIRPTPLLTELHLTLQFPPYVQRGPEEWVEPPRALEFPEGTRLRWTGRLSAPAESVSWQFRSSGGLLDSGSVRTPGMDFEWSWTPHRSGVLELTPGSKGSSTREYTLSLNPDRPPAVEVLLPPPEAWIPESMQTLLRIRARDDYGLTRVVLQYRRQKSTGTRETPGESPLLTFTHPPRDTLVEMAWDLESFRLLPGDELLYRVAVWDNNGLRGPQVATSEERRLRFPSLPEILAATRTREARVLSQLEGVRQSARGLQQMLREAQEAAEHSTEKGYAGKLSGKEILRRQAELSDELRRIAATLDRVVQELNLARLLTPEIAAKLEEIGQLLEELATPELKEALRKLAQSLETADPNQVEAALRGVTEQYDQYVAGIERTLELLRRAQVERKFDTLAAWANTLAQEEAKLAQGLTEPGMEAEALGPRQSGLEGEARNLLDELEALSHELAALGDSALSREAGDLASARNPLPLMAKATRALTRGERGVGARAASQAGEALQQLSQELRRLGGQLRAEWREETIAALAGAVADLLYLSHQEEALVARLGEEVGLQHPRLGEYLRHQADLVTGLQLLWDRLFAISKTTLFLSPFAAQATAWGIVKTGELMAYLQSEQPVLSSATNLGREAYGTLNRAALELLKNLASATAASGMGVEGLLAQLAEMARQQGQINQGTQGLFFLFQEQGGALAEAQLETLRELARAEEVLAESLKRLAEEAGESAQVLGRLDQLAEEAGEVSRELARGSLTPEVLARQERVLQRLLTAQKSLQERGESQERKAEVGRDYPAVSPPALEPGTLTGRESWREFLRRWEGRYPPEYRPLLERYYQELERRQGERSERNDR